MSDIPEAFREAPDEVKQTILSKTGNESIQPEDVDKYFSGELVTHVEATTANTTDVPPFENLEA